MMTNGFKEQQSGKHKGVTVSFRVRQTWTGALGPSAVVKRTERWEGEWWKPNIYSEEEIIIYTCVCVYNTIYAHINII